MAKTHDYQVIRRDSNDFRAGWLSLAIDGIDCDVCCDPTQFVNRGLRAAHEAGLTDQIAIAQFVDDFQVRRATEALERKAARLKAGRVGSGVGAVIGSKRPKTVSEDKAVEQYLNRGRFAGWTPEQRAERRKKLVDRRKKDLTAEWHASRAKLLASKKEQLAERRRKQDENPDMAHKQVQYINKLEGEIADLEAPTIEAATHGFQYAYGQYWLAQVDMDTDDIRAVPCMTNTTADTVRDAVDQGSDLTLDEFDGASYTTGGIALVGEAVNIDDGSDRAEFDANDFPASPANYGAGTRDIQGLTLIKFITNLNSSLPLHWLEPASVWSPDGSAFQWVGNAEGLLQMADG